ncbi:MAG: hypothetical protein SWY16_18035 [Cyanobacteriota bacterium]|nr:hypothetical protein [Cyanobacteriota bacterium]
MKKINETNEKKGFLIGKIGEIESIDPQRKAVKFRGRSGKLDRGRRIENHEFDDLEKSLNFREEK